jgi:hypothetical protein
MPSPQPEDEEATSGDVDLQLSQGGSSSPCEDTPRKGARSGQTITASVFQQETPLSEEPPAGRCWSRGRQRKVVGHPVSMTGWTNHVKDNPVHSTGRASVVLHGHWRNRTSETTAAERQSSRSGGMWSPLPHRHRSQSSGIVAGHSLSRENRPSVAGKVPVRTRNCNANQRESVPGQRAQHPDRFCHRTIRFLSIEEACCPGAVAPGECVLERAEPSPRRQPEGPRGPPWARNWTPGTAAQGGGDGAGPLPCCARCECALATRTSS